MSTRSMALAFGLVLALGLPLAASAGPLPGGTDSDGDTVEDAFDNCTMASNSNQDDTDHDGCGNACDNLGCDLTNDGIVGGPDYVVLQGDYGCNTPPCPGDCTGDGVTGGPDFVALQSSYGQSNGPSGITNPSHLASCQPAP
jgi:hypothetical protein